MSKAIFMCGALKSTRLYWSYSRTIHLFYHRVMLMMPSEGPAFLHSL